MIFKVADGAFYAPLPNRSHASQVEWGLLFDENEYHTAMLRQEWVADPAINDQGILAEAKTILQKHSHAISDLYDRMEEFFSFQVKKEDRTFIALAQPRANRTFIAKVRDAAIPQILLQVHVIDKRFIRAESLVDGHQEVLVQDHTYVQNSDAVCRSVAAYMSGLLVFNEKIQLTLDTLRQERDNNGR